MKRFVCVLGACLAGQVLGPLPFTVGDVDTDPADLDVVVPEGHRIYLPLVVSLSVGAHRDAPLRDTCPCGQP